MTDPHSFGAWLRRERERRSITLRAIADRTKIGAARLEGLERGDISHWPGGIYRRAFVRAYADVVGLDADLVVANFERVYPSDPSAVVPAAPALSLPGDEQEEMRLALVTPAVAGITASAVKTAGRDLACVLACGVVGYVIGGAVGFWSVAAMTAFLFHAVRVLGLHHRWRQLAQRDAARVQTSERELPVDAPARAEVLTFTTDPALSTPEPTRARRMLADISAVADSATLPGRRRAARS